MARPAVSPLRQGRGDDLWILGPAARAEGGTASGLISANGTSTKARAHSRGCGTVSRAEPMRPLP